MKRLASYAYFAAGMVFGFSLCLLMQGGTYVTAERLFRVGGYLAALIVWQWSERWLHARNKEQWKVIRRQGKNAFILFRYVLLRGAILSVLFVGPVISLLDIKTALLFCLIVIAITILLGRQEWSDCESHYQASMLHDAAASLKAIQN